MKAIPRTALLLFALALGTQAAAQGLSGDAFTALYAEALRGKAPELEVRIAGPMELSIERDGETLTAYLDNAYARYQAEPERLHDVIADYVGATLETLHSVGAGIDASRIVPVIKDVAYLEEVGLNHGGDAPSLAHDRYNDHLVILYAEDTPRNMRFLSEPDLEELGIPRDRRRAIAVENFGALLPDVEARGGEGTYMLIADGFYEASLLLFDDIWTGDIWVNGTMPVAGELVVAVPARDILLVTGSDDAEGLNTLRQVAEEVVAGAPYALTSQLFVYRGGQFVPFDR